VVGSINKIFKTTLTKNLVEYKKLIKKIFRQKFGVNEIKVSERTRGLDHKVFFVKTNSKEYVVKFPIKENTLAAQKWAYEKWSKLGVPVPKVVLLGRNYLIEEKIDGTDLDEAGLSLQAQQKIMYELGKLVRKMHMIKTQRFGPLRSDGTGKYKTWKNFIEINFKKRMHIAKIRGYISAKLIKKILDFYIKRKDILEFDDPRLLHNDLCYDNILVKNGRIVGIIDAGDCISGDPMYEIASMNKHFNKNLIKSFCKGYGKVDKRKINFYTVINSIPKEHKNLLKYVEIIKYHLK